MCVICMDYVWRSALIALVNIIVCVCLLVLVVTYSDHVQHIIHEVLVEKNCWKHDRFGNINWTLVYNNTENSCIFVIFHSLFPNIVYAWLGTHIPLDVILIIGAFSRSNLLVMLYLALDAAYLGVLASLWTMAFFTDKMIRMVLMMFLFPLLSLSLCAWMTIFGYYLKLEERKWQRIEKKARKKILKTLLAKQWGIMGSKEDITQNMLNICGDLTRSEMELSQENRIEDILKKELAWTLAQIGEEIDDNLDSLNSHGYHNTGYGDNNLGCQGYNNSAYVDEPFDSHGYYNFGSVDDNIDSLHSMGYNYSRNGQDKDASVTNELLREKYEIGQMTFRNDAIDKDSLDDDISIEEDLVQEYRSDIDDWEVSEEIRKKENGLHQSLPHHNNHTPRDNQTQWENQTTKENHIPRENQASWEIQNPRENQISRENQTPWENLTSMEHQISRDNENQEKYNSNVFLETSPLKVEHELARFRMTATDADDREGKTMFLDVWTQQQPEPVSLPQMKMQHLAEIQHSLSNSDFSEDNLANSGFLEETLHSFTNPGFIED